MKEWTDDKNPDDPEPFPAVIHLGDSAGRTGLWKPGNGWCNSSIPEWGKWS